MERFSIDVPGSGNSLTIPTQNGQIEVAWVWCADCDATALDTPRAIAIIPPAGPSSTFILNEEEAEVLCVALTFALTQDPPGVRPRVVSNDGDLNYVFDELDDEGSEVDACLLDGEDVRIAIRMTEEVARGVDTPGAAVAYLTPSAGRKLAAALFEIADAAVVQR